MQPRFDPSAGPPPVPQTLSGADASSAAQPELRSALPPFDAVNSAAKMQCGAPSSLRLPAVSFNSPPTPLTKAAIAASSPPTTATGVAATIATTTTFASAKNSATQRKVAKLLDITTSSDIKDLASYVNEVLPGYFYSVQSDTNSSGSGSTSNKGTGENEVASTSSNAGGANTHGAGGSRAITSATLRSALDHRAIDTHKSFLQEFTVVYQNFQRVAAKVSELHEKCAELENALSSSAGDSTASAADDFFYQIQMYQAELQLVQHHEKEVEDFRKKHHFGPAEQQVLDEGPVDMNFLNVLERVREVHRRSSELIQSQEYHEGAATVMESTYAAVARATEKIARHLLATAGTGSSAAGQVDAGSAVTAAVATAGGGVGSIAADVPEVTGFQLRCVRLLYEESPSLHEKFLDEVARLRRASVLRRYFHLLTTGSANTASGMYQSGGQPRGDSDDGMTSAAGMGQRPLEAELNNPTYFFSSLCAWLHQTIVEEQDFLHTFFKNDETDAQADKHGSILQGNAQSFIGAGRAKQDMARQQILLDTVFGGVCKHIHAALDNVLERLSRFASVLGVEKGDVRPNNSNGAARAATTASDNDRTGGSVPGQSGNTQPPPQKGPRGLTGGLTRLFMAATGRTLLGHFSSAASDEANALLQRYATVTTRAQQEAVASSTLHAPLQGVQTCVTLVQLFEYYSATTFIPLLGEGASLTRLICETAPQQARDVFQRLLRVLAAHLLDSTIGVVHRTATLRRLASLNALSSGTAAGATDTSTASSPASMYILNFLTSMTYGEDTEGVSNVSISVTSNDPKADSVGSASASATSLLSLMPAVDAKFWQASDGQLQRHSAHDLKRVLTQLILPPSPEVAAYCSVLNAVLRDTARQADLLQALSVQQLQQQHKAAGTHGTPSRGNGDDDNPSNAAGLFRFRTEVKGFVRELLRALWRSAQSVQEDATLCSNLDDPCRAIVQYNILYQLQETMERYGDVLDLLCAAMGNSGDEERLGIDTNNNSDSGGYDMQNDVETLRAEVGAAMNELRRRLLAQWDAAVSHYYFPLSAEAVAAAVLAANANNAGLSATGASAASETDGQRSVASKKEVRQVLKQIVNVYNTIASMGHLPEPVPLLPALCGSDKVRREVSAEITKNVVERVYPTEFGALQRLPPDEELAAVQEEMSPQNLAVLVDFNSPSPSIV